MSFGSGGMDGSVQGSGSGQRCSDLLNNSCVWKRLTITRSFGNDWEYPTDFPASREMTAGVGVKR
ncbi:MAG: hypothetical protein LBK96_06220 [Prevotellaceae bacterium]|nr:hypothetical protein [Prevotellaceae bacterium]